MLNFTQLHILLHAHLGILLSHPLLTVIFYKVFLLSKNLTGMEQTAKTSSTGKIAWVFQGSHLYDLLLHILYPFSSPHFEYQGYLANRGYNPISVQKQFEKKAKSIPRKDLLIPEVKEDKKLFPLVIDYNPRLPSIGKILRSHSYLIYNSPNLAGIFPKGSVIPFFRRSKNIKEILGAPKRTNLAEDNDRGCFKCNRKCDLCRNFLAETDFFMTTYASWKYPIRQNVNCKSKNVIYLITCNNAINNM